MADQDDSGRKNGRFKKGTSGNPSGLRKDGTPPNSTKKNVSRSDDWQNFATGVGIFGRDKRVGSVFNLHNLSFDQLKDLWLGDDLAARAVETIPKEAMRQGYDLSIASAQDEGEQDVAMDPAELSAEVSAKLEVLGADNYLEIAGSYERGYGGGAILIGANDGQEDMTKPLNLNKVRSLDWLTPLEARELMPLYAYTDPRAPKYGQPEVYQLMSRAVLPSFSGNYSSTTMLIHESRLLVFPGIRVSRYQVTTARGGWGESVLSRVYRVLRDFNQAWSSAGVLVTDFAQSVIKIAGLWEALALDGGDAFKNRLAAMEYGRSVTNAVTVDAADSYERQQTPLSGLPDLLEKFAVRLAAACDMPLTLLFGTSPAGMNATGESDIRFFYDRVASYQQRKIAPQIRRLCQIIFHTLGNRQEPKKWSIKFRPLWQDSNKDKAAAMFTQAQADNVWITAGVLSPEEVATHWRSGEYDPNIIVDFEAREAQEAASAGPVSAADLEAMDPNHYRYVEPPEQGTAEPPKDVPPPGLPAAPDPNTPPKPYVQVSEDSADAVRRADEVPLHVAARDERARFAGKGYGMPGPGQDSAKRGHERMADEQATAVEKHWKNALKMNKAAQMHAENGNWEEFQKAHQLSIMSQAKAAQAMDTVIYHAERAGTDKARAHASRAADAMVVRDDDWSEAAREASVEARAAHAKGKEAIKEAKAKLAGKEHKPEHGAEGKHGGEHVPGKGEHGEHGGKEHGGKEHGEHGGKEHGHGGGLQLGKFAKGAGEIVAGEQASKLAEQLGAGVIEGGEGGEGGEE